MTAARLGLRLALTGAGRLRSAALVLAAAIAVAMTLSTLAAMHGILGRTLELATPSDAADDRRLAAVCIAAITVPLAVLVVTVARLSAALRDRRLAGLRLIGMTPVQTRVVAAVESGAGAVVGTLLGYAAFWLARPELAGISVAGLHWRAGFTPQLPDQLAALLLTPCIAAAAAALPLQVRADQALAAARLADRRPPRAWRFAPVLLGVAVCICVTRREPRSWFHSFDDSWPWVFAGDILLGVGILIVVPIFVRAVAGLLERFGHGPATRIAVRRLQAQPAGVARLVSVLLLGLFLATGARFVVADWETLPQGDAATDAIHRRQIEGLVTSPAKADALRDQAAAVPGVTAAVELPLLKSKGRVRAVVASCADLARLQVQVTDCQEHQAYLLDAEQSGLPTSWSATGRADAPILARSAEQLPVLRSSGSRHSSLMPPLDQASVLLPPSAVPQLPADATVEVVVTSGPGRDLDDRLAAAGVVARTTEVPDFDAYDLAARLRVLVWTIAGIILALGLLTFGVASIDRVVQRRKQMTALRLLGVPAATVRRAQWIEAGVPIAGGTVLAIGLGALGGATFLLWAEDGDRVLLPWHQVGVFALVATAGAAVVAGLTVIASNPRIRPEEIRAE
jgi:putative ABC transport system permease protein